jgi:hypothetical protein
MSALPPGGLAQSQDAPQAGGTGAAAPEFSGCRRCHICDRPSLCLPTCTRFQVAAEEFAKKLGPDVIILDELEGDYLPVPFDHKGHAEKAQMVKGCATCHHYTPEGHQHPACKSCHSITGSGTSLHKPGLKGAYHRQCLGCHKDWTDASDCSICHRRKAGTPATPNAALPPTTDDILGRLHPPISQPTTEIYRAEFKEGAKSVVIFRHWEHVEGFDLKCVDCHHEDNCARCHEKDQGQDRPRTVREHHEPCMRCHKADMDKATTDITGRCKRCHWQEGDPKIKPFDHANTGWPLSEYHARNSCRDCHKQVPFTKLAKDCNACHSAWAPDSFDHGVTGQHLDANHREIDCEDCHAGRRFDQPPTCDECHDAGEVVFPSKRPGAALGTSGGRPNR